MSKFPVFVALALLTLTAAGCGKTDSGLPPAEEKMANRLDEITQKSGGDWNKLSADDKKYLINDVSQGSEQSARMLLAARSGKMRTTPGGPRPGGPRPGGPK